jgi:hypothetical protein
MASKVDPEIDKKVAVAEDAGQVPPNYEDVVVQEEKTYAYDDSRKLGITGSVFLILNKMIGTGSMYFVDGGSRILTYCKSSLRLLVFLLRLDLSAFRYFSGSLVFKNPSPVHEIALTMYKQVAYLPSRVSACSSNLDLPFRALVERKTT